MFSSYCGLLPVKGHKFLQNSSNIIRRIAKKVASITHSTTNKVANIIRGFANKVDSIIRGTRNNIDDFDCTGYDGVSGFVQCLRYVLDNFLGTRGDAVAESNNNVQA